MGWSSFLSCSLFICRLRMFMLVMLFLTLSGLQAVPIAAPRALQESSSTFRLPDDFRQGTEPSRRVLVDLNTGLVQEFVSEMERRAAVDSAHGEMERRTWLTDEVPADVPAQRNGGGWVRVEEPPASSLPAGFRQGTEPKMSIPSGFRQGTEPKMSIPTGFRQGTEPKMSIPTGFRQGTEPKMSIPTGFTQGTEPSYHIPEGFKQGTEPSLQIPEGFRQGTEPILTIPEGFRQGTEPVLTLTEGFRQGTEPILTLPQGFRQGTEPSTHNVHTQTVACKGEIIDGNCYEFNPTPLSFEHAQTACKALAPNAELASVTSGDLHSRLVSLVTKGGETNPVLTWLGAMVEGQQASWTDGTEWTYSDWMPGHPNVHTDKPVCVEMFKTDESWWTAADCELERASICSYPISA